MNYRLIGPFRQALPLHGLKLKGPIADKELQIIENAGLLVDADGRIAALDRFDLLRKNYPKASVEEVAEPAILLPGFIDSHTHICFGGSRARDYSLRIAGTPYQEILKQGGGIYDSVQKTREASSEELIEGIIKRARRHLSEGVTTIEVKSGYGLSLEEELKMLRAIQQAGQQLPHSLIPTCLAAHVPPKEYASAQAWLESVQNELLPKIKEEKLSNRVDIFIEDEAFPAEIALPFLQGAKALDFALTAHADQFSRQGTPVAVAAGALSADHLEASTEAEINQLAASDTVANVLPGASLGLGMQYAPARRLLDAGCCVAIASDWNPGSAPMGDLLTQAALLGAAEKLSTAETLAGLSYRAAYALRLHDRGSLAQGLRADMIAFPTEDYREILYHQGKLKPFAVWVNGERC